MQRPLVLESRPPANMASGELPWSLARHLAEHVEQVLGVLGPAPRRGQERCGAIAPGLDADLVHLDDEFRLTRVMCRGEWVTLSEPLR